MRGACSTWASASRSDNLYNLTFDGGVQFPQSSPPGTIICGWVKTRWLRRLIELITSPIYGQSLGITNLGTGTLNPPGTLYASLAALLSQFDINLDPFGVQTIRPNTDYSIRFHGMGQLCGSNRRRERSAGIGRWRHLDNSRPPASASQPHADRVCFSALLPASWCASHS